MKGREMNDNAAINVLKLINGVMGVAESNLLEIINAYGADGLKGKAEIVRLLHEIDMKANKITQSIPVIGGDS